MPIEVLSPEVASKIAAGEVVERPASAVKELVENAIDAGATEIRVEIREGGKRLLRVVDNGSGIPGDQALLAFARHSTSKLHSLDDLDRIHTLGFRGEALASIAAVAQVTMITCVRDEPVGTLLRLEGGEVVRHEGHGSPAGTSLTVENLFYNTPARRKFLRSDGAENALIAELVTSYALAYPEARFTLLNNERLSFQSTGTGRLRDVLIKAFGLEMAQAMIEFSAPGEALAVDGLISPPALHQADRKGLLFFVNRRWIQDRSLSYAVEEAYHNLLPGGRHPLAVVNIHLDPAEVDVNIHPTKREIRFRDARVVFAAVQRAVRHTLQEHFPVPIARLSPEQPDGLGRAIPSAAWQPGQLGLELQRTAEVGRITDTARTPDMPTPALMSTRLPMLRVIGQVAQTYIIAEGPGGVYLIDQHAAHERIVYERMLGARESALPASQMLLEPMVIQLIPRQMPILEARLGDLAQLGFDLEPFGADAIRVRALPADIAPSESRAVISELLDLAETDARAWQEEALITLVCHSAVRAGQTLGFSEMRDLVQQLEMTSTPHSCPHGRPTMIHLSAAQLEREFGRR